MATVQDSAEAAEQQWLEAKKITHAMLKKLEQVDKEESNSKKLLADLESLEHMLETLRLACMATTFTDFRFAHKNRVLDRLWHVHTVLNAAYKKGLQRHRGHGHIVQFRTIEKQYAKHLKTAQYFYRGFIERLSARYKLASLQRVAQTMQSGNITVDDVIDASEANLNHELTVACYRTVLHMGDIARYRMNAARQKSHSPDVAMTYYGLAQDLMPQEGDAHHQMAVVLAEQRKDFDVVYHFYRSWSVQHPFALAPKNLASEFKKLLQASSSASRKSGNAPPDPYEMFGSWFVRLHANYFKGEDFSSQGELEREVLHRWEALLKKSEQPQCLLKAVLMNMAAYDIALKKVQQEWTTAGSQSCQFILRFIVRTILVLSHVLEAETQRLFEGPSSEEQRPSPAAAPPTGPSGDRAGKPNGRNRPGEGNDENKERTAETKSTASDTCLSLFRICMAWISIHHMDLVKFQEYLRPYVVDMHRSATRCLSLFVDIIAGTEASPTSYLLPEDAEVIGLAPLDVWTALRAQNGSGAFKPRFDEIGIRRQDAARETLARIYDIVESAIHLIGDESFPWVATTIREGGRDVTKITYAEDQMAATSSAPPVASSASPAPHSSGAIAATASSTFHAKPASSNNPERRVAQPPPGLARPSTVDVPQAARAQISGPVPETNVGAGGVPRAAPPPFPRRMSYKDMDDVDDFLPGSMKQQHLQSAGYQASTGPADPELDMLDPEAYSRIQNFLSPPELHPHPAHQNTAVSLPPQPSLNLSSSSYGMHTATADDVFGQVQMPGPTAAYHAAAFSAPDRANAVAASATKTIPSSPWGPAYTTAPNYQSLHPTTGVGIESPTRDGFGFPPGVTGQPGPPQQQQPMGPPATIEEQLNFLTLAKQGRQVSASSSYGMDSLSRGFPSALSPVGTAKAPTSPPSAGFRNPWGSQDQNSSRLLPHQLLQAQAASLGVIGGMSGAGSSGLGSPGNSIYGSSNFTLGPMSSMPSVQSPRGLPAQDQLSPQRTAASGGGGFFERNPSSTAAAVVSAGSPQVLQDSYEAIYSPQHYQPQQLHQQPSDSAVFGRLPGDLTTPTSTAAATSAKWSEAATAWGRGTPASKDDPTHFRNAVRQTSLMDDTNAYDRNALLSALYDENKPAAAPR